jgi:N-methylhydantoinase A
MPYRIGVDIGGTFTDFVLLNDETGAATTHKQLTTPDDPSVAVIEGVEQILEESGVTMSAVAAIVHGTTLVTNAVLERRGCAVGMLVTRGFADILDMGRERRYDLYDLRLGFPAPLVERRNRAELGERLRFDGEVLKPLDLDEVDAALRRLVVDRGVQAIAVCLLHSYANPAHERAVGQFVARHYPGVFVSLSCDGYPVIREFERWTTTTLNAYVQPVVDRYLSALERGLAEIGFEGGFLIMSSIGGTLTCETARRHPARLLESGPAAGALMSARHGKRLGLGQLLSFDMGGTTAKGSIVVAGQPMRRYEIEAGRVHEFKKGSGLPVKIPVLDMIEIGAGGGSLAELDERGVIRVGPRSAGANPGPVCYGRGNEMPTLTDANLALGYLDPNFFLGGRMRIDRSAAMDAIERRMAQPLAIESVRAAWGIHEIINEDVARAFRVHASERGIDLRGCSMIAFGGSGPLHAVRVARKLKITQVIMPPCAGVMSAFGMLVSPLSFEVVRSSRSALSSLDAEELRRQFGAIEAEAIEVLLSSGVAPNEIEITRSLDMRYVGQGYEIDVLLPPLADPGGLLDELATLFARAYRRQFGIDLPGKDIEIINWRVEATARMSPQDGVEHVGRYAPGKRPLKGTRPAYDPEAGSFVPHAVYDRYQLAPDTEIEGPALVEEMESTSVIGAGTTARIDRGLNLVVALALPVT